jgi:glyoxylase-like metal-dependent hydrolase (beta-lactamase superfamily II)
MGYIKEVGKINDTTWLIDAVYKTTEGLMSGGMASYLIKTEDGSNCLINPSTYSGAEYVYLSLKKFEAWPLQRIIITHSHWDHTQGIFYLQEKLEKDNLPEIEILASEKAMPYLLDQSFNTCFVLEEVYSATLPNIENAIPLKEKVMLNSDYTLDIIDTPGHTLDHISIYDPQTKTLFNGDAIGMHWWPQFYVCNSNSIYWKEKDYLESIEKVKALDIEYLCIAHFGVLTGEDVPNFIDNSVSMYYKWMDLFDSHNEKLDDIKFLVDKLWENHYQEFHEVPMLKETLINSTIHAVKYYKGKNK